MLKKSFSKLLTLKFSRRVITVFMTAMMLTTYSGTFHVFAYPGVYEPKQDNAAATITLGLFSVVVFFAALMYLNRENNFAYAAAAAGTVASVGKDERDDSVIVNAVAESVGGKEEAVISNNNRTYLAEDFNLIGNLYTDGDIEIAGTVNGDINSKGKVILRSVVNGNLSANELHLLGGTLIGNITVDGKIFMDEKACVNGNIKAFECTSFGSVEGNLDVDGDLILDKNAYVKGDISARSICISKGVAINGHIDMK